MRFLITGITGFAGTHLATRLRADGHEVCGTTRGAPPLGLEPRWEQLSVVDVADRSALTELVRRLRPDGLFHLAAVSSVPAASKDPDATYRTNFLGSVNVFAAVRAAGVRCRIVWVGSCEAYGLVHATELPLTEERLFRPLSPYAVSKAAADLAAHQWARSDGLDIVRVRPFNHTGPGQASRFVCADFARQLIEIERGRRPARIDVGNLDVVRDFTDVRDVVHAYVLAWERGTAGEAYNVCSGVGRTPRDILATLMQVSGVEATVSPQPDRQRPADVPVLVGSAAKLQRATAWSPVIGWQQTLRDLLDDWRRRG